MRRPKAQLTLLIVCLLAGMLLSVIDRTDADWDLQNYHLYGPFAVLHGRLWVDYFAAGVQGYLNPLADIPYYLAKFILFPKHPVVVAGLAGLPFGMLAFIVFNIAHIMLPESAAQAALAGILGLTGATILSEIGTVYDDITVADFLLLGLWAALSKSPNAMLAAGVMAGCAAGLKFTALLFAPGLLVLCLMQIAAGQRVRPVLLFGVAFAAGFLAFWGWWGVLLWMRFKNPFFPVFGTVFPSLWSPPVLVHDVRFFPRSVLQWLFYPFFWLQGRSFVASEDKLRDPRFALAYLALAAAVIRQAWPGRQVAGLWAFFVIGYVFWLLGFSILRYAMPLEAISGIVIWTAIRRLLPQPVAGTLVLAVLCAGVLAFTKPIGWGRIGYGKALLAPPAQKLAPHSLVFLSGAPIGFVLPYLASPGSAFISLDWLVPGSAEYPRVRQLAAQAGAIRLLTNAPPGGTAAAVIEARLSRFDLAYAETGCRPIRSAVQRGIRLCDVISAPP